MDARLFVALWPAPAVRTQLAAARDRWRWPKGATPVRSEHLHLTLHFIGAVAQARVPEIAAALDVPSPAFDLTFGRDVLWPHGVAVLEPDRAPPALTALHAALGERLRTLSLPTDERPFKPHVTLARRAAAATPGTGLVSIVWPVHGYALLQSIAGNYEIVRAYDF